jgi:hypothetical protein
LNKRRTPTTVRKNKRRGYYSRKYGITSHLMAELLYEIIYVSKGIIVIDIDNKEFG